MALATVPALASFKPLSGATFCCVLGSPIAHSKSPLIHRLFAEQSGLRLQYERFEVKPAELGQALAVLHALGCLGVNVTIPLKEEARRLATHATPQAELAGAANTLWWARARLQCGNTDGLGLVNDLLISRFAALEGSRILLLGAGGAAAGVIPALLETHPQELVVLNRTPARAQILVARHPTKRCLKVAVPETTFVRPFDLVINATSSSLNATVPVVDPSAIGSQTACYDMFYGVGETTFLRWGRALGATRCRDGLGMLIEQAAVAFYQWHKRKPETPPVFLALGRSLIG
ncbi:MAG: shikimate dehydrogenase [Gammaproteobacteria bacterium]|nr:shikimate dehydrogenase [Gammaproteobacteria bacterium]